MIPLLTSWANIPSTSNNLAGLHAMRKALMEAFLPLDAEIYELPLPPIKRCNDQGIWNTVEMAPALSFQKRKNAKNQLLFCGHMDVVLSGWEVTEAEGKLYGPGVCDMKGGLIVLLEALKKLEKHPLKKEIGWEVFINPDEEMGSPASSVLFKDIAARHTTCLIFEPAMADGSIVINRKGSCNFTAIAKGVSAHAGRDFFSGKNAIVALSAFCVDIQKLIDKGKDVTLNVGAMTGGIGSNTVPDFAMAKINIRAWEDLEKVISDFYEIAKKHTIELYPTTNRPPKPLNEKNLALFSLLVQSAKKLGITLKGTKSGGVCDGNNFSSLGLATLDTLGPIGGNLHTKQEYLQIDSIQQKIDLTFQLLLDWIDKIKII
jgi:glutamate carboxypeptidase